MDRKSIIAISLSALIAISVLLFVITHRNSVNEYKILYEIAATGNTYIPGGDKIITVYFSPEDPYSILFLAYDLPIYMKNNFTVILRPVSSDNDSLLIGCYNSITYDQLMKIIENFTYAYNNSPSYVIQCFNNNQSYQYILTNYEILVGTHMLGTPAYFLVFPSGNITAINDTLRTLDVIVNPIRYDNDYIMLLYGYIPVNVTEKIVQEIQ
ncbi:MAG: hypothetical protein ACP5GJ_03515 [Nanopusillaceae archaeon]|jgi:hypothetical protein